MGTNGAPISMITDSTWTKTSSHACEWSSQGTSMPTSFSARASSPCSSSSWSRRSRSGIRAASTCSVLSISLPSIGSDQCPEGRIGKHQGRSRIRLCARRDARVNRYRHLVAIATGREYGLFINGELVEPASGEVRELTEPATGEPLARAAHAGAEDVDRAVEAARAALDGPWGKTPGNERSRLLHALADAIQANRKELAELESRNVGKAISSTKAELAQAVENFRFYASAIATIAGRSNPIGGSLLFYSLKEPVGVVGQVVPWNYPLMMATWKLAPALAAGCTIVLKPDTATPLTAL